MVRCTDVTWNNGSTTGRRPEWFGARHRPPRVSLPAPSPSEPAGLPEVVSRGKLPDAGNLCRRPGNSPARIRPFQAENARRGWQANCRSPDRLCDSRGRHEIATDAPADRSCRTPADSFAIVRAGHAAGRPRCDGHGRDRRHDEDRLPRPQHHGRDDDRWGGACVSLHERSDRPWWEEPDRSARGI